jgi:hypothetical protein
LKDHRPSTVTDFNLRRALPHATETTKKKKGEDQALRTQTKCERDKKNRLEITVRTVENRDNFACLFVRPYRDVFCQRGKEGKESEVRGNNEKPKKKTPTHTKIIVVFS